MASNPFDPLQDFTTRNLDQMLTFINSLSQFPRTIKAWNTLIASAVEASTLAVFKTELGK